MEVKRKYPAHSKRPAAPGVATLLPFNSSAATAHPSPTPRRLSRRLDRKSTRLNSRSLRHLVCRLLLEKKKESIIIGNVRRHHPANDTRRLAPIGTSRSTLNKTHELMTMIIPGIVHGGSGDDICTNDR